MPQPAPHRPRQALTSQATVMQTPTVWLPARMQHGRAGKVIGCLHERADLAPLLSTLMQRVRSRRPGSAETPDACVSSGPGWEEHLASRGPGSTAGADYQTRRNCMRRAWPEWSQATKQPLNHLLHVAPKPPTHTISKPLSQVATVLLPPQTAAPVAGPRRRPRWVAGWPRRCSGGAGTRHQPC
jgi:hypothetical protein